MWVFDLPSARGMQREAGPDEQNAELAPSAPVGVSDLTFGFHAFYVTSSFFRTRTSSLHRQEWNEFCRESSNDPHTCGCNWAIPGDYWGDRGKHSSYPNLPKKRLFMNKTKERASTHRESSVTKPRSVPNPSGIQWQDPRMHFNIQNVETSWNILSRLDLLQPHGMWLAMAEVDAV